MATSKIIGHDDKIRKDGIIVNINDKEYEKRLKVIERQKRLDALENKVEQLDEKLDKILNALNIKKEK